MLDGENERKEKKYLVLCGEKGKLVKMVKIQGFLGGASGKDLPANAGDARARVQGHCWPPFP